MADWERDGRYGSWFKRRTRLAQALTGFVAVAAVVGGVFAFLPRHQVVATAAASPHPRTMQRDLVPVPALGVPMPGPLTYGGGGVEVTPKVYLVFWGWSNTADPVAALMKNFVGAIGGTAWAGVSTQYYENGGAGQLHVTNPGQQLAGVWFDNTNPIHDNLSAQDIGNEALRAIHRFGITDFANSDIVVAQPQNANDAGFNQGQYCAWHDWSTNTGYQFPIGTPAFAFTSMPYVLNAGAGCGKDFVNAAPGGDVDGFTIVLGHEIEEAVTDPGAGTSTNLGWLDFNGEENGDKCAWVDIGPGGVLNITGNDGKTYPVQGLWDNSQLLGLGYCTN